MKDSKCTRLVYDAGTLVIEGNAPVCVPPQFEWDQRVDKFRAPAIARRQILQYCAECAEQVEDLSSRARPLKLKLRTQYTPHPYQKEAYNAWVKAGRRGSLILPTGAVLLKGRSFRQAVSESIAHAIAACSTGEGQV